MAAASSSHLVTLFVHSPSTLISSERRMDTTETLTTLNGRLEHITGIAPSNQRLQLWSARTDDPDYAKDARLIWDSVQGTAAHVTITLAQMGASDGMGLKVLDMRPSDVAAGLMYDDGSVQGYKMTEDEYKQRSGKL